mmetsp:Transcript_163040/g.522819  ORF Transcript_163040/g.522819 Transcript_163040/m.522819 type:complete len:213 (-) Transcript_163040:270-908(-)
MGAKCGRAKEPGARGGKLKPVTLHIYDVGTSGSISTLNWMLSPLGTGAFHCGVEVYDWEWSYSDIAGSTPKMVDITGVFCCRPRTCEGHSYYQSVEMGYTAASEIEVLKLICLLEKSWPVVDYDILSHNCCQFSDELCQRLGVGRVPDWVLSLAGIGAALERNTDDITSTQCCRMIAGETQDVVCRQVPSKTCCRVKNQQEDEEESDIHYLV